VSIESRRISDETLGLWLGLLGVTIFAATLPVTRLAVGPSTDPQLDPIFVASGRAAIAGVLSLIYLWFTRARRPAANHWSILAVCALGTAVAFPVFLSMALRYTQSTHAAVISGLIPLATAVSAALYFRQRPSTGFWVCALIGCALVIAFALYKGSGRPSYADLLLLMAVISTSIGYVAGARVSSDLPPAHVICWVMVITLPLSIPVAVATWPTHPIRWESWASLGYVSVFSMWLGFFAWYRGLLLGGAVRVSQVQLIQPFLALLFAVPIVGERLDLATVVFSVAVIATVLISKKMPAGRPSR
jgi:drug/metabolite transporter (DMT)-like permease